MIDDKTAEVKSAGGSFQKEPVAAALRTSVGQSITVLDARLKLYQGWA